MASRKATAKLQHNFPFTLSTGDIRAEKILKCTVLSEVLTMLYETACTSCIQQHRGTLYHKYLTKRKILHLIASSIILHVKKISKIFKFYSQSVWYKVPNNTKWEGSRASLIPHTLLYHSQEFTWK